MRKNINLGDLVLIPDTDKQGKLQFESYGLFVVANMIKPGVYRLINEEGIETSHTWNTDNLRRFYP